MASEQLRQIRERIRARRAEGQPTRTPQQRREALDASSPRAPADIEVRSVDAGGVPADWLLAPGAASARRILYLHGGGFSLGSRISHRLLAADIGRAAGCAVLIIDYRLAPEHPYPAALEDAHTAYRWLRGHGPDGPNGPGAASAVFLSGDSAGGGLALSLMLSARDGDEPLPDGAALLSAWTDMALLGESLSSRAALDPMSMGETLARGVADYLAGHDPHDPLVSPLYGELRGLPPLLLQVGDYECLLDDSTRLAERARMADVPVTLDVEPEAFHVFQSCAALIPEARAAVDRIGAFLRGL